MVRRVEYVGGSYPMGEREDGDYVEYDDYAAIESRLAELEKDAARYRWLSLAVYGDKALADRFVDASLSREA